MKDGGPAQRTPSMKLTVAIRDSDILHETQIF
jgi:hypothetical protein